MKKYKVNDKFKDLQKYTKSIISNISHYDVWLTRNSFHSDNDII